MKKLMFLSNYNNKLFNPVFSTIRLNVESKYILHEQYIVSAVIDSVAYEMGVCRIIHISKSTLADMPDNIIYLDFATNKEEFIRHITGMYHSVKLDVKEMQFDILICEWVNAYHSVGFSIPKVHIMSTNVFRPLPVRAETPVK